MLVLLEDESALVRNIKCVYTYPVRKRLVRSTFVRRLLTYFNKVLFLPRCMSNATHNVPNSFARVYFGHLSLL